MDLFERAQELNASSAKDISKILTIPTSPNFEKLLRAYSENYNPDMFIFVDDFLLQQFKKKI